MIIITPNMLRKRVYFERVPGLDLPVQLVLGGERKRNHSRPEPDQLI